tara:strand:+ start:6721 stop:7191 length:471 start_codon:yes stop_codon:yes gene_type:complete
MAKFINKYKLKGTETRADIWDKIGGAGGGGGRSATLQSTRSGPNLAGNARHKVDRPDLNQGYFGKADPKFIQKQKKKDMASKKRIKEEKAKAKASGAKKRAERDKAYEKKFGKKALADVKKLYGDWFEGGRSGIVKRKKMKPNKWITKKGIKLLED